MYNVYSVHLGLFSSLEDIISTMDDVQYIGGISGCMWSDIMSTLGMFSTSDIPQINHDITLMHCTLYTLYTLYWVIILKIVYLLCKFLDKLIKEGKRKLARKFNLSYRYIDDLIFFNNKRFKVFISDIYPKELTILPWIRGPRETKERKVGEEDGPLAERDNPLWDRTNQILSPESGLKMWLVNWSENCQTLWRFDANIP